MKLRCTRLHFNAQNTVHTGYKLATRIPVQSYATNTDAWSCVQAVISILWSLTIAKPGMAYPETNTLKSTRPTESGDLRRGQSGYIIPGFALGARFSSCKALNSSLLNLKTPE